MSQLLSDEDVAELTGAQQPAAQVRALREYGLKPFVRRDGRPRVTWDAVTQAMLAQGRAPEPDFSALKRTS